MTDVDVLSHLKTLFCMQKKTALFQKGLHGLFENLSICICVAAVILLFNSTTLANAPQVQLQTFGNGTQFPLPTAASFVVNMSLVHDPGSTIIITFSLTNDSGGSIQLGSPQSFTTIGNATTTVFLPSSCYSPPTGWRIFASAQQQVFYTTSSYLPNTASPGFSIMQNPPDMIFVPTSSGSVMIISGQTNASTTQTNLTVSNNIYLTVFPGNIGCATSMGYGINVNVDGTSVPGSLQNLGSDTYYPYPIFIPSGILGGGSHTAVFTITSPTGVTVATTGQSNFFLASPPTIVTQPANQTNNVGGSAKFAIAASGSPSPSYQWKFNGSTILGATGASFIINNVQTNNAGNYSCLVTNSIGSVLSSNAILQIVVPTIPPNIKLFSLSTDGMGHMNVTGQPGLKEVVQSSSDLHNWVPISTNTNVSGTISVTFPKSTNFSNFYRILQQN